MEDAIFEEGSLLQGAIEDSLLDGFSGIDFEKEGELIPLENDDCQDLWE